MCLMAIHRLSSVSLISMKQLPGDDLEEVTTSRGKRGPLPASQIPARISSPAGNRLEKNDLNRCEAYAWGPSFLRQGEQAKQEEDVYASAVQLSQASYIQWPELQERFSSDHEHSAGQDRWCHCCETAAQRCQEASKSPNLGPTLRSDCQL